MQLLNSWEEDQRSFRNRTLWQPLNGRWKSWLTSLINSKVIMTSIYSTSLMLKRMISSPPQNSSRSISPKSLKWMPMETSMKCSKVKESTLKDLEDHSTTLSRFRSSTKKEKSTYWKKSKRPTKKRRIRGSMLIPRALIKRRLWRSSPRRESLISIVTWWSLRVATNSTWDNSWWSTSSHSLLRVWSTFGKLVLSTRLIT